MGYNSGNCSGQCPSKSSSFLEKGEWISRVNARNADNLGGKFHPSNIIFRNCIASME